MKAAHWIGATVLGLGLGLACAPGSEPIEIAGQRVRLELRAAGDVGVRVSVLPDGRELGANPALAEVMPPPAVAVIDRRAAAEHEIGNLRVRFEPEPLRLTVFAAEGDVVQRLEFADGSVRFDLDEAPVLGLGEGGPRFDRGSNWRDDPVQYDRRGALHAMEPRWQAGMYGSRNPAPVLFGTGGWGLFVAAPWVQVDLTDADRGEFLVVERDPAATPQDHDNQQQALGKGLPPARDFVPGLFDVFVFDADEPAAALGDFARVTGPAALPPRWALGYMQSHRTLQDDAQMVGIVDTFRARRIPLDAVIYLGTGFAPVGWNTEQPSFDFNPDVFTRPAEDVLADLHARNVKVAVHMVPWDRDRLPTLHGTIPPAPDESVDEGHIHGYWQQHEALIAAGIDAFWPDEGDWFDLHERLKRHQMYYQGHLYTEPDERPWHLQRNGYPGIARWGGWVWSGDTDSAWKTLEAQIAVGLNYSLSIGPFWGSDIGGFYPNQELTGELYARWFQFGAFCGSFRSHGRVWWMRLPWGWGLDEFGPLEYGNDNAPIPADDPRMIRRSELNNPDIEPIARRYAELRQELMPYTYTAARQARDEGLPLMRPLWLHYPGDATARGLGDQYLWGRDLLVAPVYEPGASARELYLPAGAWYDWWTGERHEGVQRVRRPVDLATMPLYVRAGAIVPVDPVRQYTAEPVSEPTTLRVYAGADGESLLYEDDGVSQAYLEGQGSWIRMRWDDAGRTLTLEPGGGPQPGTPRTFRVLLLPEGTTAEVTYAGEPVRAEL